MNISRQNLSIIIVTYRSEKVIEQCLKNIPEDIKILIVDNANDEYFKKMIEKKHANVECILSKNNLGMGSGNNLGFKHIKTDFAFILNPDVILDKNTIDELINASKQLETFALIAPISKNLNYPNYKLDKNHIIKKNKPFKVLSVDGYAMLFNIKRLNQFKNFYYFDEKIFMYLENDDICKRIRDINEEIYMIPSSKVYHLGGKAVDSKHEYEIELSRNWHWIWSKFYFNKKHYGTINALKGGVPTFVSALFKYLIYFFINKKKKYIYFQRMSGFVNALVGNNSFYRPKIKS
ncbi:glycosyltransferase [Candidatus Pelagibacter sp. HIMB1506]|uniref:glycosyltransferase n=1 Tax=Candidatus Pelagibacter sp. HIMB1506 TaxID=3413337 RepID=UPI003F83E9F9